jgi:hypothetical protein
VNDVLQTLPGFTYAVWHRASPAEPFVLAATALDWPSAQQLAADVYDRHGGAWEVEAVPPPATTPAAQAFADFLTQLVAADHRHSR